MSEPVAGIIGLKALLRDLKRAGADTSELNPLLSEAGREAANPIASTVRATLPRDTGRLAGDVRVTASRTGAAVRMGRASIRYAGPVDFGGYPGDREYTARGRYLYPAAEGLAGQAASRYSDALQRGFDSYRWTNDTANGAAIHD